MASCAADQTALRLLVLCAGDPEGARPFSGSARNLIQALERRGCVHYKANVLGRTDPFSRGSFPLRVARKLDYLSVEEAYRWSGLCFARNSRRARAIAEAHPGYNACLMYGTTYSPGLDVPTYCYFDATAAQVFEAGAWEFAHFSKARAQRIIAYQQEVFDHCAAIFPRTQWAARSVEEDYHIPPERIVAAGAGPNYLAEALPHGPYNTQTILFIGTEFQRKGGPLLLEAFRRLRQSLPGARLVIVGCQPLVEEDGVLVVGEISKDAPGGLERLLQYYSKASVFCIMSAFEPFGIVILEAQHCFVPCVAPARFAFTETVVDHVTGRHVPEYDAEVLAGILTELLGDPATLEAMGAAAHEHVRTNWTWDAAARRIHERILEDLDLARPE